MPTYLANGLLVDDSGVVQLSDGTPVSKVAGHAVDAQGRLVVGLADVNKSRASEELTVGESTLPRELCGSALGSLSSGAMRIALFKARKTETITQVRFVSGSQAAAATPTLCRVGIYREEANGDLTLVASTPNDTTLFAGTFTPYIKALSVPLAKVAGVRYGVGVLVVSAAAMPFIYNGSVLGAEIAQAPRLVGVAGGLSDLPATVTVAAMTAGGLSGVAPYVVLLP